MRALIVTISLFRQVVHFKLFTQHKYIYNRVFNLSLKEGVVPFEWKEANIIPLFKKGSRNKSENYRPVSLTSVICKLLERVN